MSDIVENIKALFPDVQLLPSQVTLLEEMDASSVALALGKVQEVAVEELMRGMDITTIQWESIGGMALNFKWYPEIEKAVEVLPDHIVCTKENG